MAKRKPISGCFSRKAPYCSFNVSLWVHPPLNHRPSLKCLNNYRMDFICFCMDSHVFICCLVLPLKMRSLCCRLVLDFSLILLCLRLMGGNNCIYHHIFLFQSQTAKSWFGLICVLPRFPFHSAYILAPPEPTVSTAFAWCSSHVLILGQMHYLLDVKGFIANFKWQCVVFA